VPASPLMTTRHSHVPAFRGKPSADDSVIEGVMVRFYVLVGTLMSENERRLIDAHVLAVGTT